MIPSHKLFNCVDIMNGYLFHHATYDGSEIGYALGGVVFSPFLCPRSILIISAVDLDL